jgi:hypothetical protein
MFISVNACVIVLRETAVQWYDPKYKSPLYPFVQLFGVISGIALLFFLGWMPIIAIVVITACGIIIYRFFGKNASRTGVLKKYGHRPALFLFFSKKGRYKRLKVLAEKEQNKALQFNISKQAGVIIPLLGNEKSPEMLIEMGAAINTKQKIQAVTITEVPDQTLLEAMSDDNPKLKAIERQIEVLAKADNVSIEFESVVTHNIANTIQALSEQANCDWLVFGWNGRAYNGILFSNPLGWIVTNVNSNFALFKDNGVRYVTKVLLAIRPNSIDIKKLIKTTDQLCQFYNASFTLLHVVSKELSNLDIQEIRKKANELLKDIRTEAEVKIVQSDKSIQSVSDISAKYDLLILGTPRKETIISILFGTGKDKFAVKSNCSVLRLTIKS